MSCRALWIGYGGGTTILCTETGPHKDSRDSLGCGDDSFGWWQVPMVKFKIRRALK